MLEQSKPTENIQAEVVFSHNSEAEHDNYAEKQLAPILFVDDELRVLVSLKRKLRKQFQIECADNAEEALSQLKSGAQYAAIVSDLRMPSMGGIAFLRQARALAPETVLLILTGAEDHNAALDAVNDVGVFKYLQKPCPDDALRHALMQACACYRKNLYRRVTDRDLKHLDEMKSNFLATVNHELRTPLNHIIGMSEYLLYENKIDPSTLKTFLRNIAESGHGLRKMIETLLQLANAQKESKSAVATPVLAADLISMAATYAVPLCEAQDLAFGLRPMHVNAHVLADYGVMDSALQHIIDNAVKFNEAKGRVDIDADTDGKSVFIRISDSGIGMSPKDIQQAAEIFWQADSGLARRHGGLGVGLTLARGLIESQGGRLTMETNPSGGLTATIALPVFLSVSESQPKTF
ncbi:MAG: hybrid sensor histidine kinase/response regulator [Pseudomonadota bacterium]